MGGASRQKGRPALPTWRPWWILGYLLEPPHLGTWWWSVMARLPPGDTEDPDEGRQVGAAPSSPEQGSPASGSPSDPGWPRRPGDLRTLGVKVLCREERAPRGCFPRHVEGGLQPQSPASRLGGPDGQPLEWGPGTRPGPASGFSFSCLGAAEEGVRCGNCRGFVRDRLSWGLGGRCPPAGPARQPGVRAVP